MEKNKNIHRNFSDELRVFLTAFTYDLSILPLEIQASQITQLNQISQMLHSTALAVNDIKEKAANQTMER